MSSPPGSIERGHLAFVLSVFVSALKETGDLTKFFEVKGEIIPKPGGVDTSKFGLANFQYMINVCVNF